MSTPRRLILMRHAKSAWDTDVVSDHARPLNGRGRRDAPRMAAWLVEQGWAPDAVVSSDATRTRETWDRMAAHLPQTPAPTFSRDLYHAGMHDLRRAAGGWPEAWQTVLALGHNPGWEVAACFLSGRDLVMKTATCVLLKSTADSWSAALAGPWELAALQSPRLLPG